MLSHRGTGRSFNRCLREWEMKPFLRWCFVATALTLAGC
ncbi:lipoprotein NlpI, partial [Salmonella enterica]|nr:lipoprotein NlpI [Salmonella enterica]